MGEFPVIPSDNADQAANRLQDSVAILASLEGKVGGDAESRRSLVLSQLVHMHRGTSDRARGEALFQLTRQLHVAGRNIDALHPALLATDLLQQSVGDSELTARAYLLQGVVLASLGNHADATSRFNDAHDIGRRLGSPMLQAMAMNNRGNAFVETGALERGLESFSAAFDRAQETRPVAAIELSKAASNSAYTCRLLGRYEKALEHLNTAVSVLTNAKDRAAAQHLTNVHANAVEILLLLKRIDEARAHEDLARLNAQLSGARLALLRAEGSRGLLEVADGAVEQGIARIERSVAQTRPLGQAHGVALMTLSQAQRLAGKPSDAKGTLRSYALETRRACLQADGYRRAARSAAALPPSDGSLDRALSQHDLELKAALTQMLSDEAALLSQAVLAEAPVDDDGLHIFRVGGLAGMLAERLRLEPAMVAAIRLAACVHDIGMIGVPQATRTSDRLWPELDDLERHYVRLHPVEGVEYIATKDLAHAEIYEQVIRHHHERFDGRGYPDGLAGEAIPLPARIVAICDAFESMTRDRPYAAARALHAAVSAIRASAGSQFDPRIAAEFVGLITSLGSSIDEIWSHTLAWTDSIPVARAARMNSELRAGQRPVTVRAD